MVREAEGGTQPALPWFGPGLLLSTASYLTSPSLRSFSTDRIIHPQDTEEWLRD